MHIKRLERRLAKMGGFTESEVDHRMRSLRALGVLPASARGPGAQHVGAGHAALAILSLVAPTAAGAGQVAVRAACLPLLFGDEIYGHRKLFGVLSSIIGFPEQSTGKYSHLRISSDGGLAVLATRCGTSPTEVLEIKFTDNAEAQQRVRDGDGTAYRALGVGDFGRSLVIGGEVLAMLGLMIEDDKASNIDGKPADAHKKLPPVTLPTLANA